MNKHFVMESNPVEVVGIRRRTGAKMFCSLVVGDKIKFSLPISPVGTGHNGRAYTSGILITNLETLESVRKTANELPYILDAFDLEECK